MTCPVTGDALFDETPAAFVRCCRPPHVLGRYFVFIDGGRRDAGRVRVDERKEPSDDDKWTGGFVNTIEVDPSKQDELIKVLAEGTEKVIQHRPGFVSVTLLTSKDGTRVVNYAVWRSADDAMATQNDPAAQEYAKRAAELGKPSPSVYAVAAEYQA